jgi:hypothetical protein
MDDRLIEQGTVTFDRLFAVQFGSNPTRRKNAQGQQTVPGEVRLTDAVAVPAAHVTPTGDAVYVYESSFWTPTRFVHVPFAGTTMKGEPGHPASLAYRAIVPEQPDALTLHPHAPQAVLTLAPTECFVVVPDGHV